MSKTPQQPQQPHVGDIVADKYKIVGTLGRGAMGAVYAAQHVATGQKVALKFMIVSDQTAEIFASRFEREAQVMAGLRNPHTIRIYDFGRTHGGALYMAMEQLEGQGLDAHIKELASHGDTMTQSMAVQVAVQVLRSLGEAHAQGLVHRDLKPGNVFLTDDGGGEILAKVLDFGIARVQDSSMTNTGALIGTPAFMAPEQWRGESLDARADLYAIGGLLYNCVTGDIPFRSDGNPISLMYKHLTEEIPDPRLKAKHPLTDTFVAILHRTMAKSPDDRYPDAKTLRQVLEAELNQRPRLVAVAPGSGPADVFLETLAAAGRTSVGGALPLDVPDLATVAPAPPVAAKTVDASIPSVSVAAAMPAAQVAIPAAPVAIPASSASSTAVVAPSNHGRKSIVVASVGACTLLALAVWWLRASPVAPGTPPAVAPAPAPVVAAVVPVALPPNPAPVGAPAAPPPAAATAVTAELPRPVPAPPSAPAPVVAPAPAGGRAIAPGGPQPAADKAAKGKPKPKSTRSTEVED